MQLFKDQIALSGVCLCKCDRMSRLPISCVNYTFINQVSYIHIKLSDIYVKRYIYIKFFYFYSHINFPDILVKPSFPYQCIHAYIEPTFLYLENKIQVKFNYVHIFINQESLVQSISKRKRESENQPYNKTTWRPTMAATNLFKSSS